MSTAPILTPALIAHLRAQFRLNWQGIHGAPHWARVRANGLRLAARTGARVQVVELFAFLHDARREDEGLDPGHGERAAEFAAMLAGRFFHLAPDDLTLLLAACRGHSHGGQVGDVTVLTCWDADRLDLGRVGIRPSPERLCTAAARDPALLQWAWLRSVARRPPG